MDGHSTYASEVMESEGGVTRPEAKYDWQQLRSRRSPKVDFGTPSKPSDVRLLECEISVLERENNALRIDNSNKARRIIDLEFALTRLRNELESKCTPTTSMRG